MSEDGPELYDPSAAEAERAALYATLGDFLRKLLARMFDVPPDVAELLVDEAFTTYSQLFAPPGEARAWIIGGACILANTWRQSRGLPAGNEQDAKRFADAYLPYRDASGTLPPTFRKALRLWFERKTYPEIAEGLGVSTEVAARIVSEALTRVRGLVRPEGGER